MKEITLEELTSFLHGIFTNREDIDSTKDPGYVGPLGNGLFRLPYGAVTGHGGWKLFTDELGKLVKNDCISASV